LGEKEVVLVFRVDVGDAPGVADDFDGFFEAGNLNVAVELGEDGFGAGQEGVGGFGGEGGGGHEEQEADGEGRWGFHGRGVFGTTFKELE
jgi:hypothetical protein